MVDKIWYDWQNAHPENFWSFLGGSVGGHSAPGLYVEFPTGGPPFLNVSEGSILNASPLIVADSTVPRSLARRCRRMESSETLRSSRSWIPRTRGCVMFMSRRHIVARRLPPLRTPDNGQTFLDIPSCNLDRLLRRSGWVGILHVIRPVTISYGLPAHESQPNLGQHSDP